MQIAGFDIAQLVGVAVALLSTYVVAKVVSRALAKTLEDALFGADREGHREGLEVRSIRGGVICRALHPGRRSHPGDHRAGRVQHSDQLRHEGHNPELRLGHHSAGR